MPDATPSRATNAPKTGARDSVLLADRVVPSGAYETMARRRYQDPTPKKEGKWWYLFYWKEHFVNGRSIRKRTRHKLAPHTMGERDAKKLAAEFLRPLNQGLETIGAATPLMTYLDTTYRPTILPLFAKSTRDRYENVIKNHLLPAFGQATLRDLTTLTLQKYFSAMHGSPLAYESRDKIRDVLGSILKSAVEFGLLVKNPMTGVKLPRDKKARRTKPYLTPEHFDQLIQKIPEPYATMVYVAVFTGLRVSELIGLRWRCINEDSITIEERYCRGEWGIPKSEASAATIPVNKTVINRLQQLKTLTVSIKAGRATRTYPLVKKDGPDDLVFQSVKDGKPMRDNNILTRHLKPAARTLGLDFLNWRCLRTSHATWLKMAGADIKDAQAQLRHSRASTTLDIYQQFIPASQRQVVDRLTTLRPTIQ